MSFSILRHIYELRLRIFFISISFSSLFLCCYVFHVEFLFLFLKPLLQNNQFFFMYTHVLDAFMTFWYISFFFCFILIFPFVLNQLWCFIKPGLYVFEKKQFVCMVFSGCSLLFVGIFSGYIYFLPLIWSFLLTFAHNSIQYYADISNYIVFLSKLLFFLILLFEFPLVLFLLYKVHFITINFLIRKRFWFDLLLMLFAAMVTPGEFSIQFFTFLLLFLLYEFSLVFLLFYTNMLRTSSIEMKKKSFNYRIKLSTK
jgi:sec-independent protein translocase protein TatC